MPLDDSQRSALTTVLHACASQCERVLGNLLEGSLKVAAAEALLLRGYAILESANLKGLGRVVSLRDGRLHCTTDSRPAVAAFPDSGKLKMSPDLRVWEPCRLVVELQTRSCFGSQSAVFSDNMYDDLRRVGNSLADAFVFVTDRPIYDALRGIKTDTRGRKAKHAEIMHLLLPPSEGLEIWNQDYTWSSVVVGPALTTTGVLVATQFGIERCVVGFWKA